MIQKMCATICIIVDFIIVYMYLKLATVYIIVINEAKGFLYH